MERVNNQRGILSGRRSPSYHHPLKQVKYHRQVQPPFCCPNGSRTRYPVGIGFIGAKVTLKLVGSRLCPWFAFRRNCALPGT